MKKKVAPALKKVASKLAKVEEFCEVADILPEIKNPAKRRRTMEVLLADLADETSQYILGEVYRKLNENSLTSKIIEDSITIASNLDKPSVIRTSWIETNDGVRVSVKDVYRIAYHKLGVQLSNKDFNTHQAIEELKFFTRIYRSEDEGAVPHFITIVE